MKVASVLAVLVVVSCADGPVPAPPTTFPAPEIAAETRPAREPQLLDAPLLEASRARGLRPTRAVELVVTSRADLILRVKRHIARDVSAASIRDEGIIQKLLGTFPLGEDYETLTYRLLEGALAGYYEPADGRMYLAQDLDPRTARETVTHELVHALQDQHWDLGQRARSVPENDDRNAAASALAEGDATSVMLDLAASHGRAGATALDTPDPEIEATLRAVADASPASGAPRSLRAALVAPYVTGVAFVHALRREGGWSLVDEAWARPPLTTEQVLHPEKWRLAEPPLVVSEPPSPRDSGGLSRLEVNTYGELGLRLALAGWVGEESAMSSASGWGGDRLALFGGQGRRFALAWHVRFDSTSTLAPSGDPRAFTALAAAARSLGRVVPAGRVAFCVERRGNGVMAVQSRQDELVLVFGTTVLEGGRGRAEMPCTAALAWSNDVLDR